MSYRFFKNINWSELNFVLPAISLESGGQYLQYADITHYLKHGRYSTLLSAFAIFAGKGITLFLVEKERGVQVGKIEDKMGLKTSVTSEVIFDDVRIPADHLIGEEGRGFNYAMKDMDSIRPMSMTYAVGIMQRALDEAVNYAKLRKTFGKPIIMNQGLAFLLADMQKMIHVSRSALLYIAHELDAGHPLNGIGSSAKIFVSDCAMKLTVDAVQVFGGYGYMKEYPVEKLMRDAKIFAIFEGTNQIQQNILAGMLSR